jgi:hypothetical protein
MKNCWPLFIILLLLSACEKVIQVDINNADTQYVIEGNITNQSGPYTVTISQTADFYATNDFSTVTGALVIISDGTVTDTLQEVAAGTYETNKITGEVGKTYQMNVYIDDNHFSASSVMPPVVPLDSVYIEDVNFGTETYKCVTPQYNDPAGQANYYKFNVYRNGERIQKTYVQNDELTDGKKVSQTLINNDDDDKLEAGDWVDLDMLCIDKPVYNYFYSLDNASGNSQSATPSNPVSNIDGGALGYFSAHTVQRKSIRVQ